MQGDTSQTPVTQKVQPEVKVKDISQTPQQPPDNSLVPPKQTPPEKPKKKPKKKIIIMLLILLPVLAIVAYGVFVAITYWNCTKITPQACETNTCGFSVTGFHLVSEMKDNCCGNALCEEGFETNSDCPADCPDCDDNSRLTADSFNYKTQRCENIATHYFVEDFEEGKTSISKKVNWKIIDDQGSKVLDCPGKKINGVEHDWANFGKVDWVNYKSELSFKLVENLEGFGLHFFSKGGQGYIVDIRDRKITFKKGSQQSREEISLEPFDFKLDQWYVLKTEKTGSDIKIYIDDAQVFKYTDDQPFNSGQLRIETFGDGHVRLDDISIQI
jgi:hypothetical protein